MGFLEDDLDAAVRAHNGRMHLADEAWTLVRKEVWRAMRKFPEFNSAHEGYAVLLEEVRELEAEVFKGGSQPRDKAKMRKEAIQVAAVAIRFLTDINTGTDSQS